MADQVTDQVTDYVTHLNSFLKCISDTSGIIGERKHEKSLQRLLKRPKRVDNHERSSVIQTSLNSLASA